MVAAGAELRRRLRAGASEPLAPEPPLRLPRRPPRVVAGIVRGLGGLGGLLLLEHGLLLDLIEQGAEAHAGVARGRRAALGLEFRLTSGLLGLFLGTTLGLLLGGAGGLSGGLGLLGQVTLLLAAGLGGETLSLLLGGGFALGGTGGLLLGALSGLDLGGTVDHGSELLFDHGDEGVFEGRRRRLCRDLHLFKVAHEFLGRHAELLGQAGNTDFRHIFHLPLTHGQACASSIKRDSGARARAD